MASITATDIQRRRDALMAAASRCSVLINKPDATSDATAGVFLVKDPDPGDAPNTTATAPGNAKGGNADASGQSWKSYSYSDLGVAYNL